NIRSGLIALALLTCILLYDLMFKGTVVAPVFMGGCRALNLLFGFSLASHLGGETCLYACAAMLIYVAGFTFFGRDEVGGSRRSRLIAGTVAVVAAQFILLVLLAIDFITRPDALVFWLALLFLTLRSAARAIRMPSPEHIQRAMVAFIYGIVL